jgi:carbamoyl-phosphate synthase small subunit
MNSLKGSKITTLESKYTAYNARLILEDGSIFSGTGFGYTDEIVGEIVFNTGMVGYTEALTDPSYRGQILCLTYPIIGNYGVPTYGIKDKFGLPRYFESEKIQIKGLLIHDLSHVASHWSCVKTLDEWLYDERIPGIYGIDTRELTKKLRVKGVMNGALAVSKDPIDEVRLSKLAKSEDYEGRNFMPEVSVNQPSEYGTSNNECIVLLDTGTKYSIIRNIIRLGYKVIRLPWDTPFEKIKSYEPRGVVISNGPGDPKTCTATVMTASKLIEKSIPTLGICLGNQILALAGGADTYKLKFGHRGQNKPCRDLRNNQTYITSQNHGYGIDPKSLYKTGFRIWFSNIDDNTIEGIEHKSKPIIAVQFHPEASPGPNDCMFIFDRFKEIINDFNKSDRIKKTARVLTKENIKARKRRKIGKR